MLALVLAASILAAPVPAKPPEQKLAAVTHTGHFERNDSGLKGETSLLVFTDTEEMGKVLGTIPPLRGKMANPVPADAFEKNLVVVVIKRKDALAEYSDVTTILEGTTLKVSFTAKFGIAGTANFATPLVMSVPKEGIKSVVFVGNGKESAPIEVK